MDLPSLTDEQITALTGLGQQVQDHYGSPQDIEWALDESGRLWLTQARPITTLYPLPDAVGGATTRVYMCLSLAQGLTRPITPMGLAAFRLIATSVASAAGHPPPDPLRGPAAYQSIGQRLFVDLTGVVRNRIGRHAVLAVFGVMEARAAAVIRGSPPIRASHSSIPRRCGRCGRWLGSYSAPGCHGGSCWPP